MGSLKLRPRQIVIRDAVAQGDFVYHSRGHRKNRRMEFRAAKPEEVVVVPPVPTLFKFDYGNISWQVAVLFCLGSICWIVNGQYALMQSDSENVVDAIGYSALCGGLLFWVGAYFAVLEALNTNSLLSFGNAVKELEHHHLGHRSKSGYHHIHFHLHRQKDVVGKKRVLVYDDVTQKVPDGHASGIGRSWRWWGYEPTLGFVAAFLQFIGATFFAVAVICGTPNVIGPDQWELQQAFIWTGQTVGSVFFIISSWMMMVEEQESILKPNIGSIGWESAFWNLIGSIGFLLSAVFGYLANWEGNGAVCCQLWGTAFNTYYGSWCFMIASLLLYYEVENQHRATFRENMSILGSWLVFKMRWCGHEYTTEEEEGNEEGKEESQDAKISAV